MVYDFRFIINFLSGKDIAFHFNPRFGPNFVVRNSRIKGKYTKRETGGGMPFTRGKMFEVKFTVDSDQYVVSLIKILYNINIICYYFKLVFAINGLAFMWLFPHGFL